MGIDIEHLRTWIGREQIVTDHLCDFPARALGAILDHDRSLSAGDALPPSWHWLYFLETGKGSMIGLDGHPQMGGFFPPIPLPRRMWAAGLIKVSQPLRLGQLASRRSRVRSVEYKIGKSGELVFVVVDHELSQGGTVCIQEEQTLVYRAMPTGLVAAAIGERAPTPIDWSSTFRVDSVALFRFSAITFNAHRIHYDRDYAMREELYPGLVVHAPLLVTLLLDLWQLKAPEESLTVFRFRALRPTFDMSPVQLYGNRQGRHVKLWTVDAENCVGVSASAELREL